MLAHYPTRPTLRHPEPFLKHHDGPSATIGVTIFPRPTPSTSPCPTRPQPTASSTGRSQTSSSFEPFALRGLHPAVGWFRHRFQVDSVISKWRSTSVEVFALVQHPFALAELADRLLRRMPVTFHRAHPPIPDGQTPTRRGPLSGAPVTAESPSRLIEPFRSARRTLSTTRNCGESVRPGYKGSDKS